MHSVPRAVLHAGHTTLSKIDARAAPAKYTHTYNHRRLKTWDHWLLNGLWHAQGTHCFWWNSHACLLWISSLCSSRSEWLTVIGLCLTAKFDLCLKIAVINISFHSGASILILNFHLSVSSVIAFSHYYVKGKILLFFSLKQIDYKISCCVKGIKMPLKGKNYSARALYKQEWKRIWNYFEL